MLSAIGMYRQNPRPVLAASPNPSASIDRNSELGHG